MDVVERVRPFEGVPYELRRDEAPEPPAEEPLDLAVEAALAPTGEGPEPPAPEPLPEWGQRALQILEDL